MSLELPRADDLRILRSLCHYVFDLPEHTVSVELVRLWLSERARRATRRAWKKSRIYHYTSAARELGLLCKKDWHHFCLTSDGERMAECRGLGRSIAGRLTRDEKELFATILPKYPAVREYMALFMPDRLPAATVSDFLARGRPIRVVTLGRKRYQMLLADGTSLQIDRVRKMSYAWTLYRWFHTLGILDDLYIERPASFLDDSKHEVRAFFPIRHTHITTGVFRKWVVEQFSSESDAISRVYIPEVLEKICTTYGVPKKRCLSCIVDLHESDPIRFPLEMMSSLRADPRCLNHHGYENFPEVQGIRRSHLWINVTRG